MNVVVGSTSPHKLEAVRQACRALGIRADVSGHAVVSAVSAQPFGLDEIVHGAKARSFLSVEHDLAIGIESGLVSSGAIYFDLAAIVVRRRGKIVGVSLSTGIVFPDEFVQAALSAVPRLTVGEVMHNAVGCCKTDGTAFLTGGRYDRSDQLAGGVIAAFAQARIP